MAPGYNHGTVYVSTVPVNPLRSTCAKEIPAKRNTALNAMETQRRRVVAEHPANLICFISRCMAPSKETTNTRANTKIPSHAVAPCAHRNRNPDVQAAIVEARFLVPGRRREPHRLPQQRAFKRYSLCEVRSRSMTFHASARSTKKTSNPMNDDFLIQVL